VRRVEFDPDGLTGEDRTWWDRWSAEAEVATQEVVDEVAAGRRPGFRTRVWSELKRWLLDNVFHGKCAYCEVYFVSGYVGDADHYRPKGAVTVSEGGQVRPVARNGVLHRGYYWLAYDWRNLLPACKLCNSSNGKMSQFPVSGEHAFTRDDGAANDALDLVERPLLLNPYQDNPSDHLQFGVKGTVVARNGSQRGQHSIDVYDLSREALEVERERFQSAARNAFTLALVELSQRGVSLESIMERHTGDQAPFSSAVRDYLILDRSELEKRLANAFEWPARVPD